jgi:hypothetical protein
MSTAQASRPIGRGVQEYERALSAVKRKSEAWAVPLEGTNFGRHQHRWTPPLMLLGYFFASGSTIGTSNVAGATWPSFQSANENVTLALPLPASSGTRTGP